MAIQKQWFLNDIHTIWEDMKMEIKLISGALWLKEFANQTFTTRWSSFQLFG